MTGNRIIIPELEEIIDITTYRRGYSDADEQAIRDYYGRVDTKKLAKHLDRTKGAIECKAASMGISIASQQEKARAEKNRKKK